MNDLDQAKQALTSDPSALGSPKVDALIEAMFLAATADGEFSPEESLQFVATIEALSDRKLQGDALMRLVGTLAERLRVDGRPARLAAVAERLPAGKGRETALILAAAITASDGEVRGSENDLVADLAEALGVAPDRAIELVARVTRR